VEPTPLDYAPPPQQRRSVFVAGLLAHVIASYAVSVVRVALWAILAWPPPTVAFAVAAAAPLWVPIGFILPMSLPGGRCSLSSASFAPTPRCSCFFTGGSASRAAHERQGRIM
jgi:hypothetical protein